MRMTMLALAALIAGAATVPGALAQEGDGGAGVVPGARSEQKLRGGAGYVCTATNELHTAQCSVSCPSRETADCVDAESGGAPSCQCTTE